MNDISRSIKEQAAAIDFKLLAYEDRLSELPDRCNCDIPLDDKLRLFFERDGNRWSFFIGTGVKHDQLLRQSSLTRKMLAISKLEQLPLAMEAAQRKLLNDLELANLRLDAILRTMDKGDDESPNLS